MVLAAVAAASTACQPTTWEDPVKTRDEILAGVGALETFIQQEMTRHALDKVSVAIVSDNQVVYVNAFGAAPTDRLRAGSISKVASSYAALQLVASGRLSLDEPLETRLASPYIPNAAFGKRITLRHVLTHTSGLRNDATGDDRTVYYAPGTVFHYSGGGFEYLSTVLEAVVGEPLDRYMERTVLAQLGMQDSTFSIPELEQYSVSAAYSLQATPTDVARLFIELLDPRQADRMLEFAARWVVLGALLGAASSAAGEGSVQTKNHYLEIAPQGGLTVTSAGDFAGGGVGLSLGYARRVSRLLAVGPGLSFFYGVPNTRPTSGGALLFKAMVGDTSVRSVALLADVGAGYVGAGRWFIQADAGVFLAGFVVKAGYLVSAFGAAHSVLLSVGYTVSF